MYILEIKTNVPVDFWIKNYLKNFHDKLYKDNTIILGNIIKKDDINNIIQFRISKINYDKLSSYQFTSAKDYSKPNIGSLEGVPIIPIFILSGMVLTYFITKGLLKEFRITSVNIKEVSQSITIPLITIAAIIFILSGGLKLFRKK